MNHRGIASFSMNTSVLSLDGRGANRRYRKLIGPLLQPEMREQQASLKPVDVTDQFLQGVGHGGCRRVHQSPRAVAVVFVVVPRARRADDPLVVAQSL
jgi:hypothetical protein